MPDDKSITMKNSIGMGVILGISYGSAFLLKFYSATVFEIFLTVLALFLVTTFCIGK